MATVAIYVDEEGRPVSIDVSESRSTVHTSLGSITSIMEVERRICGHEIVEPAKVKSSRIEFEGEFTDDMKEEFLQWVVDGAKGDLPAWLK